MRIESAEGYVAKILEELTPGCVMTKFVLIAEGIDTDGDRTEYTVVSDGIIPADILGMLELVLTKERAKIIYDVSRRLEGMDDED